MKKFTLLLLDANIVIYLFKFGIWERVIRECDVHLAETVMGEAHFYTDDQGTRCDFDLSAYRREGTINVFSVTPSELVSLRSRFTPLYLESLDPGETESLAWHVSYRIN